MSEDSSNKPTLKAGEAMISKCPFPDCGVEFANALTTNEKHTCPSDGGCGRSFKLITYN